MSTYVLKPNGTPLLTKDAVPVPNIMEVFCGFRVRPSGVATEQGPTSAAADLNVELLWLERNPADETAILAQEGASTALGTVVSALAIGVHKPIRKRRASQGDTVTISIGGQTMSFNVGGNLQPAQDPTGEQIITESDVGLLAEVSQTLP